MEIENLLTYFTKDKSWKTNFFIMTLLLTIINVINITQNDSESIEELLSADKIVFLIISVILLIILFGYNILNINSLANNKEIKLANFKNIPNLIITGIEFILGLAIYFLAGSLILFLIFQFQLTFKNPSSMVIFFICPIIIAIVMIFFALYSYLSFSKSLTFKSMFAYSQFRKFQIWKYIVAFILTNIVTYTIIIVLCMLIQNESVLNYLVCIVGALIQSWSCFILAKVGADTIKEASENNNETNENN